MFITVSSCVVLSALALASGLPYSDEHEAGGGSGAYTFERRTPPKGEKSLQPATVNSKPILPLEFWDKVKKKPRGKHLKTSRLMRKMGSDYNPEWMSVERPSLGREGGGRVMLPEDQVAALMEQVADLDIGSDIREMLGDHGEPTVSKAVGAFEQWLVKKSSCPVEFEWRDLGEYFWPRYVRQGRCGGGGPAAADVATNEAAAAGMADGSSCSWPRGMSCNPADAEVLQILRWHCRRRKTPDLLGLTVRQKIRRSYKCRWIKVPYPITSSCRCE